MAPTQEAPTGNQPEPTEPIDWRTETEDAPIDKRREDDNDRVFQYFEPTVGFHLNETIDSNFFWSHDHANAFQSFLTCGPIPHRFVDFDYLDSHDIFFFW